MAKKPGKTPKSVEIIKHDEDKRKNIPTAEHQSVILKDQSEPRTLKYPRNTDLDPQLVWRGKDEQDWSELVVHVPPIYIQEKVHPKVLIDDLLRRSKEHREETGMESVDLFADFNGMPEGVDRTEFYQHDQNWTNRMILGDSLHVMASLAEREGLRGKVQCIYIDPPYGIKFNSNFQWSTTSRDVKDGKADHITREPEQVKAFRDTWRDGIHSYLTYLRDRLTVARDLLKESGSIFMQMGDENVHLVRALMDELFGPDNFVAQVTFRKTGGLKSDGLASVADYLIWYARDRKSLKLRRLYLEKVPGQTGATQMRYKIVDDQLVSVPLGDLPNEDIRTLVSHDTLESQGNTPYQFHYRSTTYVGKYKPSPQNIGRLAKANRLYPIGNTLRYIRRFIDFPVFEINQAWDDTVISGFSDPKLYVVQTMTMVMSRCMLLTSDPGDLILDPTCGSGTTAFAAEQWGRRWITIDTSRVALALARARIMGARYPFYLLADSRDGQLKEAEVSRTAPSSQPTHGNIRQGFVYERVPHVTLKSIANNAEIDVIWDKWQEKLEPLRDALNKALKKTLQEWEIPREADAKWSDDAKKLQSEWWKARIARQKEIDASIAAKAEFEFLYDKPYEDKKKVRVAGPFTVESLSPHRMLGVDENDELIDNLADSRLSYEEKTDFAQMILENLKISGVQQAHKEDRITFTSLTAWPGKFICADGRYLEGGESGAEKRAAIFVGPEFGTVQRADLVEAAREAGDAGFDVVIACAFNYEAHATEFTKLGRIPVLKARMNADLHMAGDLKNTGKGNLFVIFGEPDIDILDASGKSLKVLVDGKETYPVSDGAKVMIKVNGVDVFHPQSGEVRSDGPDGIACWFIDTDYNEESFFVRHAYFLGANDPYGSLKTTLKAEIDPEAWATLNSDTSRPFTKPKGGRIAVKVINHLGDEVMKVFRV